MLRTKRILTSTGLGLFFACISIAGTAYFSRHMPMPPEVNLRMLVSITLIGFVLGISDLHWPWLVHGMFVGMFVGTIEGLAGMLLGPSFLVPFIPCVLIGILTEFIITVGFKFRVVTIPA